MAYIMVIESSPISMRSPARIHRCLVADSNVQSTPTFARALAAAEQDGPKVLIPDALADEIMRSRGSAKAWAETLARNPSGFYAARATGLIVADEIAGRDRQIADGTGTAKLRTAMVDIARRGDAALDELMAEAERARAELSTGDTILNADHSKAVTPPAREALRELFDAERLTRLKSSQDDQERSALRVELIRDEAILLSISLAVGGPSGAPPERMAELVGEPTLVRATALLTAATLLYDIEHGRRVETMGTKRTVNDAVDGQAVLLGVICEDLLSADGRSRHLFDLVRRGMNLPTGQLTPSESTSRA